MHTSTTPFARVKTQPLLWNISKVDIEMIMYKIMKKKILVENKPVDKFMSYQAGKIKSPPPFKQMKIKPNQPLSKIKSERLDF